MTEPTLGEVLRRLNEVSATMQDMAQRLERERVENAVTFVRKDVYDARHVILTERVKGLEQDADDREKAAEAFRRQVLVVVIGVALPAFLALVLAVNNFLAAGGQTP